LATPGLFPTRGGFNRPRPRPVDLLVLAALVALVYGLIRLGPSLNAPFLPSTASSRVSTDPANLPYYAVRSLLRMFVGLGLSVVFTFAYATAAATHTMRPQPKQIKSTPAQRPQTAAVPLLHNCSDVREPINTTLDRAGFSADLTPPYPRHPVSKVASRTPDPC
jgi:hypothetical protein